MSGNPQQDFEVLMALSVVGAMAVGSIGYLAGTTISMLRQRRERRRAQ